MRAAIVVVLLLVVIGAPALADEGEMTEKELVKDVLKRLKDRDAPTRAAAATDAAEVQDKSVTAQLIRLVKDKDMHVRQSAIEALAARSVPAQRKQAAQALAARLPALAARPVDLEEYRQVIAVLHDLAEPCTVKALLDIDVNEERDTAGERLMAVANIPCAEAIEGLIALASKGRNRGRNRRKDSCIAALHAATGQKLGSDPDKWRAWWKDAKAHFDFEAAAAGRAEKARREADKEARREANRRKREERGKPREDE